MALTQGSQMPDVTTTQTQSSSAPSWYTDYMQNVANQGASAAQNAQFVGIQPMQQQSYDLANSQVGNYKPLMGTAGGALDSALGVNGVNAAQPYLNSAANPTYNTVQNYMNPYTNEVVNKIGDLAQSNMLQNVAPQATAGLVGSGQFGSQRGAQALGQTLANYGQQTTAQQVGALNTGYNNAMTSAARDAALQAQIGQTAGNLSNTMQSNLNTSAQVGGALAGQTQQYGLNDVNTLNTLGTQQQQIEQARQLFPLQMAQAQAGLLQGYNVPLSTTSTYTGPVPGAYQNSPLSTGLGTLSSIGGLFSSSKDGVSAAAGFGNTLGKGYDYLFGNSGGNSYTANPNYADTITTNGTSALSPYDAAAGVNFTAKDVYG